MAGTAGTPSDAVRLTAGARLIGRVASLLRGTLTPDNWRLWTRVVVAAFGLLAILFAIILLTYSQSIAERRRAEVDNAVVVGRAVANFVDSFAQDLETTTLTLASAIGGQDGPITQQSAGSHLRRLAEEYQVLRGLFVTDTAGRVIVSQSGEGHGLDLSTRPYMQALMQGAPKVWGPGVAGLQTGEVTVTFGREIRGPDGMIRGYLVAAFYPPRLAERLEGTIPPDADVTLVDSRGLLLHSTQRPDLSAAERDLTQSSRVQAALRGEVVRVEGAAGFFGAQERFGVIAPVPRTGWAVAFTRPLGPLEETLRIYFLRQAGGVALAVLVVGMLLTLATRRIALPLGQLAHAATAVARGERPVIPTVPGSGETGQLAAAMQTMASAVAEREDALNRQAARLAALAEVARLFAEAGLDLEKGLVAVAERVGEVVGDGCSIALLSEDGHHLEQVAMYHPSTEAIALTRSLLAKWMVHMEEGSWGSVAQRGETVLLEDVSPEEALTALPPNVWDHAARLGLHSLLAVPLRTRDRVIGVMTAWHDATAAPYTAEDRVLLQEIADRVALAIENTSLFREAQRKSAALERAMQAHDELLALVTHDLKNPLTTIKATAQVVRLRLDRETTLEPDRLAAAMAAIDGATVKAMAQIDALLDLARLQTGRPLELARSSTDVIKLVRAIAAEYQQTTESHRIVVSTAELELVGEYDAPRLERAFGNLLSNALKYSPDGGDIQVMVSREHRSGVAWAVVTIRDHGLGIPATALPQIFDRFYRADNVTGRFAGTGLGLSAVRYLVEEHGGTIAVESTEGAGSTFTVRLPVTLPTPDGTDASTPAETSTNDSDT